MMLDLSLIFESLLKILALKCFILNVVISSNLKCQKNEENTTHVFYKINYICYHIEFLQKMVINGVVNK